MLDLVVPDVVNPTAPLVETDVGGPIEADPVADEGPVALAPLAVAELGLAEGAGGDPEDPELGPSPTSLASPHCGLRPCEGGRWGSAVGWPRRRRRQAVVPLRLAGCEPRSGHSSTLSSGTSLTLRVLDT